MLATSRPIPAQKLDGGWTTLRDVLSALLPSYVWPQQKIDPQESNQDQQQGKQQQQQQHQEEGQKRRQALAQQQQQRQQQQQEQEQQQQIGADQEERGPGERGQGASSEAVAASDQAIRTEECVFSDEIRAEGGERHGIGSSEGEHKGSGCKGPGEREGGPRGRGEGNQKGAAVSQKGGSPPAKSSSHEREGRRVKESITAGITAGEEGAVDSPAEGGEATGGPDAFTLYPQESPASHEVDHPSLSSSSGEGLLGMGGESAAAAAAAAAQQQQGAGEQQGKEQRQQQGGEELCQQQQQQQHSVQKDEQQLARTEPQQQHHVLAGQLKLLPMVRVDADGRRINGGSPLRNLRVVVAGIEAPLAAPIAWLHASMHAPDFFLYVVVR